jgi:hypothetical protein
MHQLRNASREHRKNTDLEAFMDKQAADSRRAASSQT